jgi:hypothetical protein
MLIAPLISSSVAGPLGISHLPRLWLKIVLHACGRLPEGYRYGEGGFDEALCDALELDRVAFVNYIVTEKPDYLTLERYVSAHAGDLSPRTIAAFNQRVRAATLPAARAALWRERFGITDETYGYGVPLNDLDDWATMHAALLASSGNAAEIEQL